MPNAEKRALRCNETEIVPRVSDMHSLLASTTGKIEMEYVGEDKKEDELVEKLINAVDHVLIAGCWRAGIDPESDQAPTTISDAAREFFKVRNGRLDSLTAAERTNLADNIQFVATGPKSAPNYLIIDKGEGQSPLRFPTSFLSLRQQTTDHGPRTMDKGQT